MEQENNRWIIARDMAFDYIKVEHCWFIVQFKTIFCKKYSKMYDELTKNFYDNFKDVNSQSTSKEK